MQHSSSVCVALKNFTLYIIYCLAGGNHFKLRIANQHKKKRKKSRGNKADNDKFSLLLAKLVIKWTQCALRLDDRIYRCVLCVSVFAKLINNSYRAREVNKREQESGEGSGTSANHKIALHDGHAKQLNNKQQASNYTHKTQTRAEHTYTNTNTHNNTRTRWKRFVCHMAYEQQINFRFI